jgi:uridine kinase
MASLVIGIAGGTGSGKTTVTNAILDHLDRGQVAILQHDSYYRDLGTYGGVPPEQVNFDHPDSLDTPLLIEHLKSLRAGRGVDIPIYDFTTHRRSESTRHVEPRAIIILDGILILAVKALRELMDIRIFVDADADERLIRRIERDTGQRGRSLESIVDQYLRTVKPMHLEFVEPSKRWADIIIPRGAENSVAIEMVAARIQALFRGVSGERD